MLTRLPDLNSRMPQRRLAEFRLWLRPHSFIYEKADSMSVSMYTVSIPVFIQHLNGLNTVLDKAATWVAARKVNEGDLLNMRLSPDMFNLARQVRAATDHAANAAGALREKSF
jgi:hypothetical protein